MVVRSEESHMHVLRLGISDLWLVGGSEREEERERERERERESEKERERRREWGREREWIRAIRIHILLQESQALTPSGLIEATAYKSICMQHTENSHEDCLFLNVFTPIVGFSSDQLII